MEIKTSSYADYGIALALMTPWDFFGWDPPKEGDSFTTNEFVVIPGPEWDKQQPTTDGYYSVLIQSSAGREPTTDICFVKDGQIQGSCNSDGWGYGGTEPLAKSEVIGWSKVRPEGQMPEFDVERWEITKEYRLGGYGETKRERRL